MTGYLLHKPTILSFKRATHWSIMWTRKGPRIVRPTDFIVTAPTGCTWPMRKRHVDQLYAIYEANTRKAKQIRRQRLFK